MQSLVIPLFAASIAKNAGAVIGNIVGSSVDMAETLPRARTDAKHHRGGP